MIGSSRRTIIISAACSICLAVGFAANDAVLADSERRPPATLVETADLGGSAHVRFISGSESVVPVSVEAGEAIVDVSIDGHGPLPMMFDTGAEDALTPETADALGLEIKGAGTGRASGGSDIPVAFTRVKTMRLGNMEMADQPFVVLALPPYFTDRGSRPPLAGFIGYQLLTQFVVRLDYEGRSLTLRPAGDFRHAGNGVRLPLVFTGKTPAVSAAADGIPGTFAIDTGATGALALRREFVEQYDLETRHPSGLRIKAIGANGPYETIITRLNRLDIAGSRIDRPAARFPSMGKGAVPFTDVDGSIGYEILRQFVITFDYPRRQVWLERSSAFGTKTAQGKTGFQAIKMSSSGFRVITVLPNTPAAAVGMRDGDLITEVDGQPVGSMSQAEFSGLMQRPDGTMVHLGLVRDGTARPIALILKEVLP